LLQHSRQWQECEQYQLFIGSGEGKCKEESK
jgi:hypothetical protein